MTEISILDLQNLRHLISGYSTTHCKMTDDEIPVIFHNFHETNNQNHYRTR